MIKIIPKAYIKGLLAIGVFALISAFIFFAFIPFISSWIRQQSVYVNFIIFNLMVFVLIEGVLYFIINGKVKSLKVSGAVTLMVMAIDCILPSYAVSAQGQILTSQQIGFLGAIDYVFADIGMKLGLHANTINLPIFVYIVMPVILLAISLIILGGKKFTKNFAELVS